MAADEQQDTREALRALINQVREGVGRPPLAAIDDDAHLRDDLDMDSLDLAELVARIDARFGVDVFAGAASWTVGGILARLREAGDAAAE